jgi:hypothetical protein
MKKVIYLIALLISFVSCEKGQADFVLRGTLTDITLNVPHQNALVEIYKVPVGSSVTTKIGELVTGSDGKYTFTFKRDKTEKYVLKIQKEGYFDLEKNVYFSELSIESDNIRNYSTTAKSWVKLRFINQNPSSQDHLIFIKQLGKEDCLDCCSAAEQNFYGALDTTIYCINDAFTTYSYYYWIAGSQNQGLKSATTGFSDTTEILLTY